MPGTYEYRGREGVDKRVKGMCTPLIINRFADKMHIELPHGEPFTYRFFTYHGIVNFFAGGGCGALYRIGD